MYNPESALKNETRKLLWGFWDTNRSVYSRLDLEIVDKKKKREPAE